MIEERVYSVVSTIPEGRVSTYKEVAGAIGCARAWRAVGNALNKNRDTAKVPCHRVVKSDGRVGGYASGAGKKIALLLQEGVAVKDGVVDLKKHIYRF